MATYYASSSTGSNGNPGTMSQPWASVTYAFTQMLAADILWLLGGDTFTDNATTNVQIGGIGSYGTGKATLVSATGSAVLSFIPGAARLFAEPYFSGHDVGLPEQRFAHCPGR